MQSPMSHASVDTWVACEQALWGALVAGQEKEGELATTTSLEFEYLHSKKSMRNADWQR